MKRLNISIAAVGLLMLNNCLAAGDTVAIKSGEIQNIKKTVNLQDAMRAALKNNAGYAISKIDNKMAGLARTNAYAVFAPNIDIMASTSKTENSSEYRSSDPDSYYSESDTSLELVGQLNLFHGFTTVNNLKSKTASKNAAKWKLDSETANLIYSVTESIVNLWYAHEDFKSAEVKKDNLFKELQAQRNSFKAGAATKFDVAKAEANYEQAVYEADVAKLSILSAEAEFTKLTGEQASDLVELPDFDAKMPGSNVELEKIALVSNTNVLEAKETERAANYDLKVSRGRLAPRVDLTAKGGIQNVSKHSYPDDGRQGGYHNKRSVSLQMTIPVLSSNESSGNAFCNISMANENAKKAAMNVKNVIVNMKKECSVSYNNYITAMSMIKASESAVKSAKIGAEGDRQESALGLKSNTETLVRENQMYDSKKSLARSKAQLVLAKAAMLRLMGKLNLKLIKV